MRAASRISGGKPMRFVDWWVAERNDLRLRGELASLSDELIADAGMSSAAVRRALATPWWRRLAIERPTPPVTRHSDNIIAFARPCCGGRCCSNDRRVAA